MGNSIKNIIIIGLQPWYTQIGSTCKSIALELSKTHQILYVNTPINRKAILKKYAQLEYHYEVIRKKKPALIQLEKNFWNLYPPTIHESINWIPVPKLFDKLNQINNKRLAKDIQWAVNQIGFKNYILFNDNDMLRGYYLKEILNPDLYIYLLRDFVTAVPYFQRHGSRLEPLIAAKADIAIGNSKYMLKYLKRFNPNSYFVGTGCDIKIFNGRETYPIPDDLKSIPHPIVGYTGALIVDRLDINIIEHIARTLENWSVVLIGPEDRTFAKSILHHIPNIYFLGLKKPEELPIYVSHFDVCINPQLINQLTIGNYPLKIDEYLAMGKPVVATKTDAMQMFLPYCYLAKDKYEFTKLICIAHKENNHIEKERRIQYASTHTWENTVKQIMNIIDQTLERKTSNHFHEQ